MGALQLPRQVPAIDFAAARSATVTKTPAEAVGLKDRVARSPLAGEADLIRVHVARDAPVVRSVWREGQSRSMSEALVCSDLFP